MFVKYFKAVSFIITLLLILGCFSGLAAATVVTQTVNPDPSQTTYFTSDDLNLEVPAGATDQTITITEHDPDLNGIKLPYGFQPIGKEFDFGPSGLQFPQDKLLKARFNLKKLLPTRVNPNAVRLYYLNREKGILELVPEQQLDADGNLVAHLAHFSSYIPAVNSPWNGDGINPFMDYVHEGEEHDNVYTLTDSIIATVYQLKGRGGMDLKLAMAYHSVIPNGDQADPLYICSGWHWDLPHVNSSNGTFDMLYLPGGTSFTTSGSNKTSPTTWTEDHYFNGERVTYICHPGMVSEICFKDGSNLTFGTNSQIWTDAHGNKIQYNFTTFQLCPEVSFTRMTSLVDSAGHTFNFTYPDGCNLGTVTQTLSNSQPPKPILTLTQSGSYEVFTDAVGRSTSYNLIDSGYIHNYTTIYPNQVQSVFSSNTWLGTGTHNWYYPGQTTPFRTVSYTQNLSSVDGITYIYNTTANDGNRIQEYTFTDNQPGLRGYTELLQTYALNNGSQGNLLKQVTTSFYTYSLTDYGDNESFDLPHTVTTQFCHDGTPEESGVETFEYDSWENITRDIDPNGTETRMAYANTDSDANLSDFTPGSVTTTTTLLVDENFEGSGPYAVQGNWSRVLRSFYQLPSTYCLGATLPSQNPEIGQVTLPAPYSATKTITINNGAQGTVSFEWAVLGGAPDVLYFIVDGVTQLDSSNYAENSPINNCWYTFSCSLAPGTHTLEWRFFREYVTYSSGTTSYIDNINISATVTTVTYLPQYQNYYYASQVGNYGAIGYDKLLTKATFVKDSIHGTTLLKQSHYLYNSQGDVTEEREVYGSSYVVTDYGYDIYGNQTSKTDADGNQLCTEYNLTTNYAYPASVYNSANNTIATYDYSNGGFDIGKPDAATDPNNNSFSYSYDFIGRLTSETLNNSDPNVGVTKSITYYDTTDLVRLKFGNDAANNWEYGQIYYDQLFGKPTLIQRQLNGSWVTIKQMTYDTDGRLATEATNLGYTTSHQYDGLNREIQTTFPDSTAITYSWDDRTLTTTDANNNKKTQIYDLLDRLATLEEYPGDGTTDITSYLYDTDSHLIQTVNPLNAKTSNTYDSLGRLTRTDYPQGGTNPLTAETFSYDGVGNLTSKTNAKGTKTIGYEFYSGYRVKTVTEADGQVVSYTYDNNDNILTQTYPGATYTYSNYDARNRAHNLSAQLDSNTFNFGYDYDVFGRMSSITYPNLANAVSYNYDDLDRLQSIPGFVTSCGYDLDNKLTDMLFGNSINNHYDYRTNDDKLLDIQIGLGGSLLSLNYSYDNVGNIKLIFSGMAPSGGNVRASQLAEDRHRAGQRGNRHQERRNLTDGRLDMDVGGAPLNQANLRDNPKQLV